MFFVVVFWFEGLGFGVYGVVCWFLGWCVVVGGYLFGLRCLEFCFFLVWRGDIGGWFGVVVGFEFVCLVWWVFGLLFGGVWGFFWFICYWGRN